MAQVKLVYFDVRGRAELIRLVLSLSGQTFEDVRCSREDWPKYKPDAPFGQGPYADINGQKYGQSAALATYFARENNLYGKSNLDALRIDEVQGLSQDIWSAVGQVIFEKDEDKKAEISKKLHEDHFPRLFGSFRDLLNKNSPNGVIVGNELTLADLCVFDMMYSMLKIQKYDAADAFPELKALQEKVKANPKIKAYLEKREDTEF